MTWEELLEKAKKLKYRESKYGDNQISLEKHGIIFVCNGKGKVGVVVDGYRIMWFAVDRTPDQMYQIMLALED